MIALGAGERKLATEKGFNVELGKARKAKSEKDRGDFIAYLYTESNSLMDKSLRPTQQALDCLHGLEDAKALNAVANVLLPGTVIVDEDTSSAESSVLLEEDNQVPIDPIMPQTDDSQKPSGCVDQDNQPPEDFTKRPKNDEHAPWGSTEYPNKGNGENKRALSEEAQGTINPEEDLPDLPGKFYNTPSLSSARSSDSYLSANEEAV